MNKKKLLTIIMTVLMMLSLLPSSIFAGEDGTAVQGKLKVSGKATVSSVLEADLSELRPEGMTSDMFSYQWYRMENTGGSAEGRVYEDSHMTELGTDTTYEVAVEDAGYIIVLKLTGKSDKGLSGTVYAESGVITWPDETAGDDVDTQDDMTEIEDPAGAETDPMEEWEPVDENTDEYYYDLLEVYDEGGSDVTTNTDVETPTENLDQNVEPGSDPSQETPVSEETPNPEET
ncbi:MAG: hypothetical protein Q4E89_13650, partial [Eubacteriales bacterium]|nr:hypothetical protein [Eubacteriales bacterium]